MTPSGQPTRAAARPALAPVSGRRSTDHSRPASLSPAQLLTAAGVPLLAALLVYLPALSNGFIWDDPLVLQQLRAVHSVGDLLVPPPVIPHFYFRPVIFVSYLLDRALGGETPFWFHASVLAFHALNTLLVFVLARQLFAGEWLIASGGALLFAVFPTHVESVAWMAGRSDVIVCTFVLLTILLFLGHHRAWSPWLGGVTFLLAALSKEMAVACVLLVPLLDLLSTRRLAWRRYLPLAVATAVYFVLRQRALGAFVGGMATGASAEQLGADLLRAVGFYVVRAVLPLRLCAYIPEVPNGLGYLLAGGFGIVSGAALIAIAWRRGAWQLAFLGVWFFATLFPSLTVIVRRSASALVADRYLYVPSVASCLLLAWCVVRIAQRRQLAPRWPAATLTVATAVCALVTIRYTRVWADDLAFWSDVTAKAPEHTMPRRELAAALQNRGRLEDAERQLQQALTGKSDPEDRAMTYNNLGILYRRLSRYADAGHAFEAGIQVRPHPTLYHNWGMALMAQTEQEQRQGDQAGVVRDITKAREVFEQALRLGNVAGTQLPQWEPAKTHALLGQVLYSLGNRAAAREHLDTALRLEPNGPVADLTRRYLEQMR